jgi:hypothetical protein
LAYVLKGAEIHPFAVFDVDRVMDYVSRHRITVLAWPTHGLPVDPRAPRFAEFDLSSESVFDWSGRNCRPWR